MKKIKYLILIVLCIMISSIIAAAGVSNVFELAEYNIKIGNNLVSFKNPIWTNNGTTYVPLRNLCEELNIPVSWDEKERMAIVDTYNAKIKVSEKTEYKTEGVIPDEETALIIGKILLEKYAGRELEYETEEKVFYLKVDFFEKYNAWEVYQTFKFKDGGGWAASGISCPRIVLSKNTGEVIMLNTYSTLPQ